MILILLLLLNLGITHEVNIYEFDKSKILDSPNSSNKNYCYIKQQEKYIQYLKKKFTTDNNLCINTSNEIFKAYDDFFINTKLYCNKKLRFRDLFKNNNDTSAYIKFILKIDKLKRQYNKKIRRNGP